MAHSKKAGLQAVLCASVLFLAEGTGAQNITVPAEAAFSKARKLYDTPVDSGLRGFRCDVDFDWKDFMQKASNQPVPDGDARLKYLQSVHLSVEDDLRGTGSLQWNAPAPPPDTTEASVEKIRDGLQQIWAGFFQTWNGFPTGEMYMLDSASRVERTPAGFHVSTHSGPGVAEEQFDGNLLLKSIHVASPELEIQTALSFTPGPHGLLLTTVRSATRQPPSAPETEVTMDIGYAPVGAYQLPSQLKVSVGTAVFAFHLANCTIRNEASK